ncbi:MAG: hypothetical protein P8078_02355 [bacterium]
MKVIISILMTILCFSIIWAQEEVNIETSSAEISEGLDLEAVAELFKDAEDLEAFEQSLNDPDIGINNLDLDENNEVDFIRVLEEVEDDVHLIILQAALAEEEYQDVATIEIEQSEDEDETYNMQIHGNEDIYGSDYYVTPVDVRIHTWPIIKRIYRPAYHPYRSPYLWGRYPKWWKRYRPVTVHVYKPRLKRYTVRAGFVLTHNSRMRRIHRIKYTARRATVIKHRRAHHKRAARKAQPAPRRVKRK